MSIPVISSGSDDGGLFPRLFRGPLGSRGLQCRVLGGDSGSFFLDGLGNEGATVHGVRVLFTSCLTFKQTKNYFLYVLYYMFLGCVYFHQNKKRRGSREGRCHSKTMMIKRANESLKYHSSCVTQTKRGGKSTREGVRNGVGRHERMKRGIGMKDRDERSRGIEIRMTDAFAKIKPTSPFKVTKHETLRNRN